MTTTVQIIQTTQTEILQFFLIAVGGGIIVGTIIAIWSLVFKIR